MSGESNNSQGAKASQIELAGALAIAFAAVWATGWLATQSLFGGLLIGEISPSKEKVLAAGAVFLLLVAVAAAGGWILASSKASVLRIAAVTCAVTPTALVWIQTQNKPEFLTFTGATAVIVMSMISVIACGAAFFLALLVRSSGEGNVLPIPVMLPVSVILWLSIARIFGQSVLYSFPPPIGTTFDRVEISLKEPEEKLTGVLLYEDADWCGVLQDRTTTKIPYKSLSGSSRRTLLKIAKSRVTALSLAQNPDAGG